MLTILPASVQIDEIDDGSGEIDRMEFKQCAVRVLLPAAVRMSVDGSDSAPLARRPV